jgi:hypothetical protein
VHGRLVFDTTPRFALLSTGPASGKTRALEMIMMLSRNGQALIDPTPASFAMMCAEHRATTGIDEIDILFGAGSAKQVLRSLLNSGYKRGAVWPRANGDTLSVFAPLVLAGMGKRFRTAGPLDALRTRCLMVDMVPCGPDNRPETFRDRLHAPTASAVRQQLGRWCTHNSPTIGSAFPELPPGIEDRTAELAEPLLQVADVAGGHWPETARTALLSLLRGTAGDETPGPLPLAEQLFADLALIFARTNETRLSSVAICEALCALPGRPWAALWPSAASAPRELAALLSPFGIEPSVVRVSATLTLRGYRIEDLAPLFPDTDEQQVA